MTSGLLSQFVLYAVLGASSLGELSQVWSEAAAAAGAAGRIGELLAIKPRIAAPARPKTLKEPVAGRIVFDKVSFGYAGAESGPALEGVDLVVEPGERVALVGLGRWQIHDVSVVAGFYDVDGGAVRSTACTCAISIPPAAPRHRLRAAGPGDFGASVSENIAYGRDNTPRREIEAAARRAQAHDFIAALPKAMTRSLASAASRCPAASASVSPSPGRYSPTRRFCCSTRRPRRSTRRTRRWCRRRWTM